MSFSAEVVLEGIAKAGSRGKCTPMGRAAMSLDLQALQRGLAELAGAGGAEAAADALRIVDTYIKVSMSTLLTAHSDFKKATKPSSLCLPGTNTSSHMKSRWTEWMTRSHRYRGAEKASLPAHPRGPGAGLWRCQQGGIAPWLAHMIVNCTLSG